MLRITGSVSLTKNQDEGKIESWNKEPEMIFWYFKKWPIFSHRHQRRYDLDLWLTVRIGIMNKMNPGMETQNGLCSILESFKNVADILEPTQDPNMELWLTLRIRTKHKSIESWHRDP